MAGGGYGGGNLLLVKDDSGAAAQWAKSVVSGSDQSKFRSVVVENKRQKLIQQNQDFREG